MSSRKHIGVDIRSKWVQLVRDRHQFEYVKVGGNKNPAGVFTKLLDRSQFDVYGRRSTEGRARIANRTGGSEPRRQLLESGQTSRNYPEWRRGLHQAHECQLEIDEN